MGIHSKNTIPSGANLILCQKAAKWNSFLLCVIFFVVSFQPANAIIESNEKAAYEEIYVLLNINKVGRFYINATYYQGEILLSVIELFEYIHINQNFTFNYDTIKGFFINESDQYLIDFPSKTITIAKKTYQYDEYDLIKSDLGLYISCKALSEAFGLICSFNERSLTVDLHAEVELPAIREMRLKAIRDNIISLNNRDKVLIDTTLNRDYHKAEIGMIDWYLSSTQFSDRPATNQLNLGIGGELFGGELNTDFRYNSAYLKNKFDPRGYWHWANNDHIHLKQVQLGYISTPTIATTYGSLIGVEVTNAPTQRLTSFGEYTISDFIEPGWTVELYVNYTLVNYAVTDASGFFSFDVPLSYGITKVKLKFYGPYGEERIRDEEINIPYQFLPKGVIEYALNAGALDDGKGSIFSRFDAKYGINRFATVGMGMEYLSTMPSMRSIPFVTASVSPIVGLLAHTEFAYGASYKTLISYRFLNNVSTRVKYSAYFKDQDAIRNKYGQYLDFDITSPYRLKGQRGYAKFKFEKNFYNSKSTNKAEIMTSNYFGKYNTNLSILTRWSAYYSPIVFCDFGATYRMSKGFKARVNSSVNISAPKFMLVSTEIQKRFGHSGYLSFIYNEGFKPEIRSINLMFRFDLNFMQTSASTSISKFRQSVTTGLRGSIAFDRDNNYAHFNTHPVVGRGGFTIVPFLDINHNAVRDTNEHLVANLNVRIQGARILRNQKDSLIRVSGLELYTSYIVKLDDNGFDKISWKVKNKTLEVYTDPNQFKQIEVPIQPMGEASGFVYFNSNGDLIGVGRVPISFYAEDGTFIVKTSSESDGYFSFIGLSPGKYNVRIDPEFLAKNQLESLSLLSNFEITMNEQGDYFEGLELHLSSVKKE